MADVTQGINWFQVVPALIGGGAMGALLTAAIASFKSRTQPVRYEIRMEKIFGSQPSETALFAKASVMFDDHTCTYTNLTFATLEIVNTGNKDIDRFIFGVTLSPGSVVVFSEMEGADRHHEISTAHLARPNNPRVAMDFTCTPFNKANAYLIKLYIINTNDMPSDAKIDLSTPMPVRFSAAPPFSDQMIEVVSEFPFSEIPGVSLIAHLIKVLNVKIR
jgi:hypothetical protein